MKQLTDKTYFYACIGFGVTTGVCIELELYGAVAVAAILAVTNGTRWALKMQLAMLTSNSGMRQLTDTAYFYACMGFGVATSTCIVNHLYSAAVFTGILSITFGVRWAIKNNKHGSWEY